MIEKTVDVGGRDVAFKSSAAIPRLYRARFKRDIFADLMRLEKSMSKAEEGGGTGFEAADLEIFENVAYIMALHADPSVPKNIDEWLEQFEMFSIYQVLPEILSLWGENMATEVESRKNSPRARAR